MAVHHLPPSVLADQFLPLNFGHMLNGAKNKPLKFGHQNFRLSTTFYDCEQAYLHFEPD